MRQTRACRTPVAPCVGDVDARHDVAMLDVYGWLRREREVSVSATPKRTGVGEIPAESSGESSTLPSPSAAGVASSPRRSEPG